MINLIAALCLTSASPVDRWIDLLGSDDITRREDASAALIKAGKAAIGPLEKALSETKDEEVRGRIRELLAILKIPPGGGKPVDGLRIELSADKKELRPGETVKFKVVVRNLRGHARNLYVGYSTGGVYFVSGKAFAVTSPDGKAGGTSRWNVGFCGTGAGPLHATIPAYGTRTFETSAVYQKAGGTITMWAKRTLVVKEACYTFGPGRYFSQGAPAGRTHRFRIVHAAKPGDNVMRGFGPARFVGKAPSDRSAPFWTGAMESNTVELTVGGGK